MNDLLQVDILGNQLEAICLDSNTYKSIENVRENPEASPPSSPPQSPPDRQVSDSDEPTKSPQTLRKLIKFKKPLQMKIQNESVDVSSEASASILPKVEVNESTPLPPKPLTRKIRIKKSHNDQLSKGTVVPTEATVCQATNELELIIGKFICGIFEDDEDKSDIGDKTDSFDLPPQNKWVFQKWKLWRNHQKPKKKEKQTRQQNNQETKEGKLSFSLLIQFRWTFGKNLLNGSTY